MTPDPPLPKSARRLHIKRWLLLASLIILILAPSGLRFYDQWQAEKEVRALNLDFQVADPIETIRRDWTAAFRRTTWIDSERTVIVRNAGEFDKYGGLIPRLHPRRLTVGHASVWKDLSSISDLSELEVLELGDCTELEKLDALSGLPALRWIALNRCNRLANVNALAKLPALQTLYLSGSTELKNLDMLEELPTLREIYLKDCTGLSKESVANLKARLPNTNVVFY